MVVYADVLVVLNLIVDYFLLLLTSKITRRAVRMPRLLLAGGIGAVGSLYIFLPQSVWIVELTVRLLLCAVMTLAAFGFGDIKKFLRVMAVLFAVTFSYAGGMMALWYIFHPGGMVINNSVVYFDISPVALTVCTVAAYFITVLIKRLISRRSPDARVCSVCVEADGKSCETKAIVDTGNSIEDILGGSEVIIADIHIINELFGDVRDNGALAHRYRLLPCSTVSGDGMLEGYRCDSAVLRLGERRVRLSSPILAVSKTALDKECPAIINPKVFE